MYEKSNPGPVEYMLIIVFVVIVAAIIWVLLGSEIENVVREIMLGLRDASNLR